MDDPRFPVRILAPALAAALRAEGCAEPAGLAWRIKQVLRQDWPATLESDGQIKRGYTPKQTLRLLSALSLIDAGLGPTEAVMAARDNENLLLAIIAGRAGPRPVGAAEAPLAALRPRVLDGGQPESASGGIQVISIARAELGAAVTTDAPGPAWIVIDIAGQAERALHALQLGDEAREPFDRVLAEGVQATLAGRGYLATGHLGGDRYHSRRGAGRRPAPSIRSDPD